MAAVGSSKAVPRRRYHNDWVEKSSSLIDDVSQPFVMGIGQVALKGSWLDGIDRLSHTPVIRVRTIEKTEGHPSLRTRHPRVTNPSPGSEVIPLIALADDRARLEATGRIHAKCEPSTPGGRKSFRINSVLDRTLGEFLVPQN